MLKDVVCSAVAEKGKVSTSAVSLHTLRLFFLFLIFRSAFAVARTDTTKVANQQYALSDPRNPDCPCHKHQKLAEDEFVQERVFRNQFDNNKNEKKTNETESNKFNLFSGMGEKLMERTSLIPFNKNKHKKKSVCMTKIRFKFSQRIHRVKKIIPDYEICYKW